MLKTWFALGCKHAKSVMYSRTGCLNTKAEYFGHFRNLLLFRVSLLFQALIRLTRSQLTFLKAHGSVLAPLPSCATHHTYDTNIGQNRHIHAPITADSNFSGWGEGLSVGFSHMLLLRAAIPRYLHKSIARKKYIRPATSSTAGEVEVRRRMIFVWVRVEQPDIWNLNCPQMF